MYTDFNKIAILGSFFAILGIFLNQQILRRLSLILFMILSVIGVLFVILTQSDLGLFEILLFLAIIMVTLFGMHLDSTAFFRAGFILYISFIFAKLGVDLKLEIDKHLLISSVFSFFIGFINASFNKSTI